MDLKTDSLRALIEHANRMKIDPTETIWAAGYRLDPYPNGKSKGELIARIETVEAERDKTRNLLRVEHDKAICKGNMALLMSYRSVHEENEPTCPVCTFLAETSSVKP